MTTCRICGSEDLYSFVAQRGLCASCQMFFLGGRTPTEDVISRIREALKLSEGEYWDKTLSLVPGKAAAS